MSLEEFFDEADKPKYSPEIDLETRRRIRLAVCAYAYEFEADPIIDDGQFDELSYAINLEIDTRRPELDAFFRTKFEPCTGQWIHDHPDLHKIKDLYDKYFKDRKRKKRVKKK